ncbi:hypothetical protein [Chryseobacterium sp. MFBS3-17]|uniref:hypothetical protein n=1 Tax=Chryseobacterium sp. MFBS3-17 TaxID=2886689 RepID=UPI001D0DF8F4|nr:hypothetical protein [Chryseobacterium sp. MFBS3-17]MCC2590433.1 hypothetical protein [Chryseobacterium sp. MFBS3-17]
MNKIIAFAALFSMGFLSAQQEDLKNWRNMKPEQRKELINKMNPDERLQLLKDFREEMMVEELDVPEDKKKDFKNLYNEYQESQKAIKEKFKSDQKFENLTEAEAKRELEKSFDLGQQLLDNRRKYSDKFQKVVKPQQVLEMFQNEGMMRNKLMDRKSEDRVRSPQMQSRGGQLNQSSQGRQMQQPRTAPVRNNQGSRTQSR